jgi:WD40 repeat protein
LDEANAQAEEAWEFLRRVRGTPKGQKKKEDRHLKSKPARIGTVVEVRENSGNSGSPIPYTETKKQRSDEQRTGGLHVQWENTSRSVRLQKVPHQSDAALPNRQDISLVEPSRKFKGHSSPVTQIAAVDKNRFISSSWDTTIRMWNADTGECIRTFRGHGDWVHAISVLDSKHFISGSDDRTVKMWSFDKEECIRTFKGHSSFVKALAPMDGDRFLSGSRDRTIKLFSVTTGRCLRTFEGHVGVVSAIAALDSDHFATGSHDQNVKYWNVSSGTCVQTLTGHTGSIKTLAALSNKEVVSGSDDKTLRLWDVTTGKCLRQFGSKDSLVFSVSYICENFILSCGGSNVKLYHIPSGTCVKSYETPRISLAVVRLDDERFVTGSDQMLYLWKF